MGLKELGGFQSGMLPGPVRDMAVELQVVPDPAGLIGKSRQPRPRRMTEGIAETEPFFFRRHHYTQPLVIPSTGIDSIRSKPGMEVALGQRDPAVHDVIHDG